MKAFGVFSSHIEKSSLNPDKGKDRRGLRSYCSLVTTGKSGKPARIVTYYRPSDESRHRMPKKTDRQSSHNTSESSSDKG